MKRKQKLEKYQKPKLTVVSVKDVKKNSAVIGDAAVYCAIKMGGWGMDVSATGKCCS